MLVLFQILEICHTLVSSHVLRSFQKGLEDALTVFLLTFATRTDTIHESTSCDLVEGFWQDFGIAYPVTISRMSRKILSRMYPFHELFGLITKSGTGWGFCTYIKSGDGGLP